MVVTGTVEAVSIKKETSTGKVLRSPLYSVKVDESWYSFGFNNPKVSKGDYISFESSKGEYGLNGDASSVVSSKTTSSGGSSTNYVNDTQKSIIFQSSRKDAIEVVKMLVDNDVVTLPTKKSDKMEALTGLIDEITVQYYNSVVNFKETPETKVEVVEDE